MSAPAAKQRTKSLPGTPRPARSSSDNHDREDNLPSSPSDGTHPGWNWHTESSPSLQVSDAAHGEGSSIIEESDIELEDSPTTSSVCPGSTPPDSQRRRRRISSASVGQTSSPSPTHPQQGQQQQMQMLFNEGDHKSDDAVPRQKESSPFDPGLFDWSEETAPPAPLLPARPLFSTTFLLPVPQDAPQSLASSRQHPHRYHPARMNYDFCLFIANLPPAYQEDHLRRVVKEHFAPFGQIQLVKVKREDEHRRWGRGDCWGWVWFDNEASALKALEQAPLTPLLGRVIRVERAKAHRSLLLEPTKGYRLVHRGNSGRWLIVPEGEEDNMESEALDVEELVHRFGRIEEVTERAPLVAHSDVQPGEPSSVYRALGIDIKFEHRDDGITALNTLRARTPQIIISWSHDPPFHSAFPPARLQPLSRAYPPSEPSRPFVPPGGVAARSPRPFEGGVSVPGSRGAGGGGGGGRSGSRGSTWGVRGRGGGGGGLRRGGGRGGGPRRIPGRPNAVENVDKVSSTSAASATGEGYEAGGGSGVDVTQDDEAKCNSSGESDDCSGDEKHMNRTRAQLEVEWPALSPNKPQRPVPGLKSKSASPAPIITDIPVATEVSFHPRSRSTEPASPRTPPNRSPLPFSAEAFTAPQPVTKFSRQPLPQASTPSLTGVSTSAEDCDTGSPPSKRPDDGKPSSPSAFETPSRPPRARLEDANRSLELGTTPALSVAGGWSPVTPIVVPTPPASLAFGPSAVSAARLVGAGPGSGAGLAGSKEDVLVDPNAIFVGGLEKKEVDERNLRDKFSPYGVITDLHYVPNAPKTQTGFAFITYGSANSAQEAVKNEHGSLFFGNKIRVQLREVPNEHLGHFRRVSREYGGSLSTPSQGMSSPEFSPTRSKPPEAYLTKRPPVPGTRGDGGMRPPPPPAATAPPFLQLSPQIALSGHHHQHPMLMAGYPMGWYPPPYYPPAYASSPLPPHLVSEAVSVQQTPGSAHPPAGQTGGFIPSPEQQQQQMMYYPPWMYHMPPHFYSYPPAGYVYSPAFAPPTREDTSASETKPNGGDPLSNAVAKTTTMPAAATIETVTSSSSTTTAGVSPSSSPVSYSSVMRYPRSATRPASSSVRQGGNGNGNGNGNNGEQRHGKTKGQQQRGEQTERIQRQGRTPSCQQQQQHQPRATVSTGPEVAAAPFYISQPPPPPPVLSASQAQQQQQATSQLSYGRLFQPRGPQHDYIAAAQQQLHAWSSAVGGGTTWPRYEPQQPSFPQQTVAATTTTAGRIDQLAQPPYYESSSVGPSGGGSRSTSATPMQQHAQQGAQGQPTPSHLSTAAPFYYPSPSQQNQYLSSYELAPLAPPPPPLGLPSAPAIPASSCDGIAPRRPASSSTAPAAADMPYPGGSQNLFQTDSSMIGPLYGGDLGGARYS